MAFIAFRRMTSKNLAQMQTAFHFFTTSGCHLCDEAKHVIEGELDLHQLSEIEIAFSEDLLNQYGTRIPVLKRLDNQHELGWPFNKNELQHFLK